jgi:hypothetical protein
MLLLVVIICIYAAVSYVHSTGEVDTSGRIVYGQVNQSPPGGVFGRPGGGKYRVELDSGQLILADGLGKLPAGYTGRVKLRLTQNTGRGDQYLIEEIAE